MTRKPPAATPGPTTRTKLLVAAFVVIASLAIYLLFFRDSPEERMSAQLVRLAHAVEVEPAQQENPIARLGRVRGEFKEIFVEDVSIVIPELTSLTRGRLALADVAAQAPAAYASASIDFASVRITLDASKKSADVTAIATVTGARIGSQPTRDVRRIAFRFDDVDGAWRIARLQVSPVASADEPR
ncbi:MAG: nuclear transport factor 2 family protein [Polyangiales bacterium]